MTTLRFVGDLPLWAGGLLALIGAFLAFAYYRRETLRLEGALRWVLPLLRSLAILLSLLVLTGPVLHHRREEGRLGDVILLVDASGSMATVDDQMAEPRKLELVKKLHWIADTPANSEVTDESAENAVRRFNNTPRIERLQGMLFEPEKGLLHQLREQHRVRVAAIVDDELLPLWDSLQTGAPKLDKPMMASGRKTGLGQAISAAVSQDSEGTSGEQLEKRSAVVLFSDGQNNAGVAPLQVARVLGSQNTPIHAVGMGDTEEPPDAAILGADYLQRIFSKNRMRGTLRIKDRMAVGEPLEVLIRHEQDVLWRETLSAKNTGEREVEFDFSIADLSKRLEQSNDQLKYHMLPVHLVAEITSQSADHEASNNALTMPLSVITQRYRVLLVDGRSRWETRYLKNAFERDDAWTLTSVITHDDGSLSKIPTGDSDSTFPSDRAALMAFDLIIFGDVPSQWLSTEQQQWLKDYVELTGGGWIWIDGSRKHLRSYVNTPLESLLPVEWSDEPFSPTGQHLSLTEVGNRLPTFVMHGGTSEINAKFWEKLPSPRWSAVVKALPGSDVLVEADYGTKRLPSIVSRRFGAGQVLYFAFDETWRWRYQAADTYHQRFWNQVARWTMRRPMAVSDDYIALDSGDIEYQVGEAAEIRTRLTDPSGRGVANAIVEAHLWKDGQTVATLLLSADPQNPGNYLGKTAPLEAGEYEVSIQASGYPASAMKARTRFTVTAGGREELLRVACDSERMTQISQESGGKYLPEESWEELTELLRPLSSGRVIESDTILWQSYWWFSAIVLLLAAEWWLRKRSGMV